MATHGSRWYLMRSDGILCQASLVGTHKSVFGSSGNLQKNIQAKLRETFGLSRNTQAIDVKFTLWGVDKNIKGFETHLWLLEIRTKLRLMFEMIFRVKRQWPSARWIKISAIRRNQGHWLCFFLNRH